MNERVLLSRRSTLKLAGAAAMSAAGTSVAARSAFAQDATPNAVGGGLSTSGLPELNVTISDTGFEGLPSELAAGSYLVHATATTSQSATIDFMQLPQGMTAADLMAMLGGGATPASGEEGEGGEPPEWFYTTHMAGGAGVGPGQTAHFVITLQAGSYVAWGEDPAAPQQPVDLSVSGTASSPVAGAVPSADLTITEVATDNGFAFQIQGDFATGPQVVAVTNDSDQPHFVEFDRLPDGTTKSDVDAVMQSFMTGTPVAGGLSEDDFQPVYVVGTQSGGTTQWHEVPIDAGTYFVACWIPDPTRGGIPHAMEGMYDVFTVNA